MNALEAMGTLGIFIMLVIGAVGLVLAILGILMPYFVYKINGRIKEIIAIMESNNIKPVKPMESKTNISDIELIEEMKSINKKQGETNKLLSDFLSKLQT